MTENPWLKHKPTPKQSAFLLRADCREILYGGAAGGGKSDALLMAALQFVDVPGYSVILFRRTYSDLALPGALMSRGAEWLAGTAARWNEDTKTWTFPSGATLSFGYLEDKNDRHRYASAEFQFCGFDELTQFPEQDYTFLFSRLRRLKGSQVPIRMRAATNPGGRGHAWVKKRFGLTPQAGKAAYWNHEGRVFVPSKLDENPHLDAAEYELSLSELDPFTRRQLRHGDWDEFEGNHFHPNEWPRYKLVGNSYVLQPRRIVMESDIWRFVVVDPAATTKKRSDHTAMMVVGVLPTYEAFILDVFRGQIDVAAIVPKLAEICRQWAPLSFAGMESVAFQELLLRDAAKHCDIPPVKELKPAGKDKLSRAVAAIVKADRNEIYLPESAPWLEGFISRLATFTGADGGDDDEADCLAYGIAGMKKFSRSTSVPVLLGGPAAWAGPVIMGGNSAGSGYYAAGEFWRGAPR